MFEHIKENWQHFEESEPGERFKERYYRRQEETQGRFNWSRIQHILLGMAFLAAGLIMMAAPGPGMLVSVLGAALLAGEFLFMARFLDWADIRVRRVARRLHHFWSRTTLPLRLILGLGVLVALAGLGLSMFLLVFGR